MDVAAFRLDFTDIEWTGSPGGGRAKILSREGRIFRLVEMDRSSYEAHICLAGHLGFVIEGELRIDFESGSITLRQGEALTIPDDVPHTPHPVTGKVTLFLSEKAV